MGAVGYMNGVNKCCNRGPEADVKLRCFTGLDLFVFCLLPASL